MDVCLLCVVRQRSLQRANHSSRGVLPTVVRRCVWSRNIKSRCSMYVYDISSLRVNDLTLILLTWRKWWTHNASKWQMGFNSAFKGLNLGVPIKLHKVPVPFSYSGCLQPACSLKVTIIIIYLSWSWATCWPVLVSRVQKSLQRSAMFPSASWGIGLKWSFLLYFCPVQANSDSLQISLLIDCSPNYNMLRYNVNVFVK